MKNRREQNNTVDKFYLLILFSVEGTVITTWVRAIWIENAIEEEGVVPKARIQGKTVRWPIGMNVLRSFNEQKEPSEDWHKFPLMKIKLTSENREDCEAYEFTTSAESDEEEGEGEEGDQEKEEVAQKIPDKVHRSKSSRAGCSSGLPPPPKFHSTSTPKNPIPNDHPVCRTGRPTSPLAGFQKVVLRLLSEIRDSVQQVGKRSEPADSDFHLVQMTNMEEFSELEENLLDIEKKRILVSRIVRIGGSSVNDNVCNIMTRLTTNELMSTFNMDGHRKKTAFRTTVLFQIIKESVLKNFASSENVITEAVQCFLKYAPDRKGGDREKVRTDNPKE
ncbi:Hypothetical predicted protein [Paramuricea clavata]|uniref:DUF4806 domain-containing protein n=1 Tax=Paramuricea clavata TaxID=317549 RepID=A0A7D9DPP7_PARCT|nr:Hypothetical predicted protein [Paramuricea clavata]